MTASSFAVIGLLVFAWAVTSNAVARLDISGPMLFAISGYVLANPDWGPLHVTAETSSIHVLVELTLALVLFSDAARVNVRELRREMGLPLRLLGIGLPLSVLLGAVLAAGLLAGLPWTLAGFLGAALAPTDAALSAPVIEDDRLPVGLRRALNVESGLNDGIVTPIVTFMLAVAASQLGAVSHGESYEAGGALRDLAVGVSVGLALGAGGAALIQWADRRRAIAPGGRRLATFALAITAFTLTYSFDGNGFIAAFVAGAAFGAVLGDEATVVERDVELPELGGELLALVVWFLFGATLLPIAFRHLDVSIAVYAVLSLTVVRMVPVALCVMRSQLDRPTMLFVSWFGPRGLASVVFALLAIEELGETSPSAHRAVATVALTVLLSVLLHGITAAPGTRHYVHREQRTSARGPRGRHSGLLRPGSSSTRRRPRIGR